MFDTNNIATALEQTERYSHATRQKYTLTLLHATSLQNGSVFAETAGLPVLAVHLLPHQVLSSPPGALPWLTEG
jgi:hypothetical protein